MANFSETDRKRLCLIHERLRAMTDVRLTNCGVQDDAKEACRLYFQSWIEPVIEDMLNGRMGNDKDANVQIDSVDHDLSRHVAARNEQIPRADAWDFICRATNAPHSKPPAIQKTEHIVTAAMNLGWVAKEGV